MRIRVLCVGRAGTLLGDAIAEYEGRAARYWPIEYAEIREERAGRGRSAEAVADAEAARLLERVPASSEIIALTRTGDAMSSERLSRLFQRYAVEDRDVTFVIGGAFGLGHEVLRRAALRLRLSTFTLPHDMARLVLAEQLYRAGTIARGEPYHKARRNGP